jgi:hypothetical protein
VKADGVFEFHKYPSIPPYLVSCPAGQDVVLAALAAGRRPPREVALDMSSFILQPSVLTGCCSIRNKTCSIGFQRLHSVRQMILERFIRSSFRMVCEHGMPKGH